MLENINKHRNYLHTIPEIALNEFKTSEYIREVLKEEGLDFVCEGTSTIVKIQGGKDECIAFRADIDGLPLVEESNSKIKSQHQGMMHACGHDGHTTMLLTFIQEINKELKQGKKLEKSLLFIFQAGEEGAGGARYVIANEFYKTQKIEEIYALHVNPDINIDEYIVKNGVVSLQNINLDITLTGKGCHGAQPHKGIDSILVGAKLVEAYQSIKSRFVPQNEHMLLTIGSFKAGEVRNVIPECVKMLGTIRIENRSLIPLIQDRIEKINKGFEVAFDVKIDMNFQPFYPPVKNDEKIYNEILEILKDKKVYTNIMLSGSEDFSFYLENGTPGFLVLLGIRNEEKGYTYALHNNKFAFDNEALVYGVEFFKKIIKYKEVLK